MIPCTFGREDEGGRNRGREGVLWIKLTLRVGWSVGRFSAAAG